MFIAIGGPQAHVTLGMTCHPEVAAATEGSAFLLA